YAADWFSTNPIRYVYITQHSDSGYDAWWGFWWRFNPRCRGGVPRRFLPAGLWDRLEGWLGERDNGQFVSRRYRGRADALLALSAAAVRYGREAAGLPVLEGLLPMEVAR